MIQAIRLSAVNSRRTVIANAGNVRTYRSVRERVVDVVAHVQIQQSVAVIVEKCGRHGNARFLLKSAGVRHIGEGPVAVVVEQLVRSKVGEKQVHTPVVVVVAGGHAETVLTRIDSALLCHVGEVERSCAILVNPQVVPIQAAPQRQRAAIGGHERVGE